MSRNRWKLGLRIGAVAAAAMPAIAAWAQDAAPAPKPVPLRIAIQAPSGENAGGQIVTVAEGQQPELPTSPYWIGVGLDPELHPLVKEQLGIEHGLVVLESFANSPAAAAGIKPNDILVKAGDDALQEPADLIKAVDAAKETELALTLIRGGKEITVKVVPAKRPESEPRVDATTAEAPSSELQEEFQRLEEVLQKLKGKAGRDGLSLSFVHPPILARAKAVAGGDFPKELRVQVTKEGETPAKIHVKYKDQEWELTEEKLNELPPEVRPHVDAMLGRHAGLRFPAALPPPVYFPQAIRVTPEGKVEGQIKLSPDAAAQGALRPTYRVWSQDSGDQVAAKLDLILKKLDQMERKSLEELQREVEQLRKDLDDVRGGKTPADQ